MSTLANALYKYTCILYTLGVKKYVLVRIELGTILKFAIVHKAAFVWFIKQRRLRRIENTLVSGQLCLW